jgi:two-component system, cell cycle response regulator
VSDEWDEETTAATDLEEIREKLSSVGVARTKPVLTVLTGSASGKQFKVSKGTAVIGRAPTVELRVEDDGISRSHARIRAETGRAWVEDMRSRNGTFVNGVKISIATELHDGDKIQVGRSTIIRFGFQDDLDESFHESLMSSALRDGLTKLFNKRYFLERLDSELKFAQRHATSLSLLMLDLDHFKKINDTMGHLAGDTVLATIANVLHKAVRNEDVVARFGGEEFAIILRAIEIDSAQLMAERVRKLVEATRIQLEGGKDMRCTASIGLAAYPATPCNTLEQLVEAADKALYRAKHAGRNRVSR